ncbi:unnamed protein product [Ambrosiozyma monospora]|uniref:Unnamed protein product n=1 Tax=Ambrosiozyma monospora TaxID=43982 RepID=A0A9W6YZN3_AMBMO|nr:unnamed protein product [Ambrosiozyma monospora]
MTDLESENQDIESQHSVELKYDDTTTKLGTVEKLYGVDIDTKFQEFEKLAEEHKQNKTLWDRIILDTGIRVTFNNRRYMTYTLAAFASIGGMLSGADQSLISGANVSLVDALKLTSREQSLVSSLVPLGAICGSLLLSPVNQWIGRRFSIMIACIAYTIGGILCAAAPSVHELYAGRFFIGIGIGLESIIPAFVSECSPKDIRGNLTSLFQFNIALGEVFGYAIAAMFYELHNAWRYILGSSLFFSSILFTAMFFLEESPRYLVSTQGKVGAAYDIWKNLRDMNDLDNKLEFLEMVQAAEERKMEDQNKVAKKHMWMEFLTNARARRSLIYANIMIFLGQFTGVNAVMYYMSTLMGSIGFDKKRSVFMSLVGGGSLLLGTIPAILYMDKFGRRFWTNFCLPGFFVGLILLGVSYQVPITAPAAKGLYLSGVILYMGFFGSYSTATWVVPTEVYPNHLRSYGMTVSSAALYLWSFIITYNFNKMFDKFTPTGLTLGFYGGIAVLGFIYQIMFVVETRKKTLEEIDDIFSKPTLTLVQLNLKSTGRDLSSLAKGRFREVANGEHILY